MDRGSVEDTVETEVSLIQICHYDLADEGYPIVFITAREAASGMPRNWVVDQNEREREVPQFLTPEQLDEFIAKLQAHRAWLAEPDPAKRDQMDQARSRDDGRSGNGLDSPDPEVRAQSGWWGWRT